MRPLSTTRLIPLILNSFPPVKVFPCAIFRIFAKYAVLLAICMLIGTQSNASQTETFSGPPALDTLGAHGSRGRECLVCHPPHNELPTLRAGAASWIERNVPEREAHPKDGVSYATADAEVAGVLLCLSCHDGNLTPQNMLASQSYSQSLGAQPFNHGHKVPSLLDEGRRNRVDHAMGTEAKIPTGYGLVFANGIFSVQPNTPYAHFVEAYGMPTLAPSMRSNPYGIDAEGRPYLVCTTCHNQHVMSVYVSRPDSPIASDHGYKSYTTFFFVNAPYGHDTGSLSNGKASSRAQFCRQCHFGFSNEGNNSDFIPTWLQ